MSHGPVDETVKPMPSTKLSLLNSWLEEHHITVHPGISIIDRPKSGIAVEATSPDKPIIHPDKRRRLLLVLTGNFLPITSPIYQLLLYPSLLSFPQDPPRSALEYPSTRMATTPLSPYPSHCTRSSEFSPSSLARIFLQVFYCRCSNTVTQRVSDYYSICQATRH